MICLQLFFNFLMIGVVSFGGGYGMISLVREVVLGHGWLTESEFLSFIAVSESTPGPLAVNMATFIGSSQAGLAGAGVVLPSFLIILLIAAALRGLMKYAGVEAFLTGVRPCVVAMILATALTMGLSTLGGFTDIHSGFAPDGRAVLVFLLLGAVHLLYKKKTQKAPSPIGMILLSAVLGTETRRDIAGRHIAGRGDGAGGLCGFVVPAFIIHHGHRVLQLGQLRFQSLLLVAEHGKAGVNGIVALHGKLDVLPDVF